MKPLCAVHFITSGAAGDGAGVGFAGVVPGLAGVGVGLAGVGVGVTSGAGAAQPKPPISKPNTTNTLTKTHIALVFIFTPFVDF